MPIFDIESILNKEETRAGAIILRCRRLLDSDKITQWCEHDEHIALDARQRIQDDVADLEEYITLLRTVERGLALTHFTDETDETWEKEISAEVRDLYRHFKQSSDGDPTEGD